ncbi:MAG: hypothetical protein KIS94_04300 [Chitinophagales bacterium]|nr:hypothetical protein [Chitinophagales bacterium]
MFASFPINGTDLLKFIPQAPPFTFITSLEAVSTQKAFTTFVFNEKQTLCFNGTLSPAGVLEHIAQSAGCKSGYHDFVNGKKNRVAFIGEIKNFVCHRLPKAGELLRTEITLEATVYDVVHIVSGKTFIGEEEIASCTLKIFFGQGEVVNS